MGRKSLFPPLFSRYALGWGSEGQKKNMFCALMKKRVTPYTHFSDATENSHGEPHSFEYERQRLTL